MDVSGVPRWSMLGRSLGEYSLDPPSVWNMDTLARCTKKRQLNGRTSTRGGGNYTVFGVNNWPGSYRVDLSTCWRILQGTVTTTIAFRGGCDYVVFIISNWPSRNGTRLS